MQTLVNLNRPLGIKFIQLADSHYKPGTSEKLWQLATKNLHQRRLSQQLKRHTPFINLREPTVNPEEEKLTPLPMNTPT